MTLLNFSLTTDNAVYEMEEKKLDNIDSKYSELEMGNSYAAVGSGYSTATMVGHVCQLCIPKLHCV